MSLSKKMVKQAQIARGLSLPELITKVGIPTESFDAIFSNDKDASKMISQATFDRLAATLGLSAQMQGLREGCVNVWRAQKSRATRAIWREAIAVLRKQLFSADIELAVIRRKGGLFGKKRYLVLIHDVEHAVRFAVTDADRATVTYLRGLFQTEAVRQLDYSALDFDMTLDLIENGVYRVSQFAIVLGGKSARYSWADVQASAKEFGFTTDAVLDLMCDAVQRRSAPVEVPSPPQVFEERPPLRVAVGG